MIPALPDDTAPPPLLEARHLSCWRAAGPAAHVPRLPAPRRAALDDVSLHVERGQMAVLVGEGGSGKSLLARLLLGLAEPSAGRLCHEGADLAHRRGPAWRRFRREVQLLFPDSNLTLDPRRPLAENIALPLRWNLRLGRGAAARRVDELLDQTGLPPDIYRRRMPHELSPLQRQRACLARALASGPTLIVADEPAWLLDISGRAQILGLLATLQREHRIACLLMTRDVATARSLAERVLILHEGRLVESGPAREVLDRPRHGHTRELLAFG